MKKKKIGQREFQSLSVKTGMCGENVKLVLSDYDDKIIHELFLPKSVLDVMGFPDADIIKSRLKRDINVLVNHLTYNTGEI